MATSKDITHWYQQRIDRLEAENQRLHEAWIIAQTEMNQLKSELAKTKALVEDGRVKP